MSSSAGRGLSPNAATRAREPPPRIETCNVVIFGETGAGKSSLVNLITAGRVPHEISPNAIGRTAETTIHDHEIVSRSGTLRLKLFDTPGLGDGFGGTVSADECQKVLKKLLQKLKEGDGIHLLVYCVRGARKTTVLRRNYDLFHSKLKEVPIALVVTGLEHQKPVMEEWWTKNEKFLSDQHMTFAAHACITTLTLRDDDDDAWIRDRHTQSYHAVCKLIDQHRLASEKGVHDMGYIGDHHEMDNPRNVIVCDSAVPAPLNICNIAGVTNGTWVRSIVAIGGHYYMFQRVTAPYPPAERSKRGIGFEPRLLIFYVDRAVPVNKQRAEVRDFCSVYAKYNVALVVVVYGSDSDEDADYWWNRSSAYSHPLFGSSATFRLTYLPRDVSGYSGCAHAALQKSIWELSCHGEPQGSVVRELFYRLWRLFKLLVGGGN